MNAVSASELSSIRSALTAAVCDTSCTIKHITDTRDQWGSSTVVEGTGTAVSAGLEKSSPGFLQAYASLIGSQSSWIVHFPHGTDVRQHDHLSIAGKTLVVQEILDPHSYAGMINALAVETK